MMVMVRVRAQKRCGHGCGVVLSEQEVRRLAFVALSATQEAAVVEHVFRHGVQSPIISLAGIPWLARYLDETIVERQVMPDGILPRGELLAVIWEPRHDKLADTA
jgi:hypothetical protein